MTTMQRLVVGVFRDRAQAEQAIHELLQAGFDHHQIRFAGSELATGGVFDKIKNVITGQNVSAGGIYDDLVDMGAPPDDARYYQTEFEAGRSIMAVLGTGGMQEAINILVRHGGYGANQRFGQGTATSVQKPTTGDEQRMKPPEKEPEVRKQPVETSETRPYKDVGAKQQKSTDVPVSRGEPYIQQRPASGLPADQPISKGPTYQPPVRQEQVTSEKQPVKREEVSFGERPVQETQQVTNRAQQKEAPAEYIGGVNVRGKGFEQGKDIEQSRETEQGRDIRRGRGFGQGGDIDDTSDQTTP
jgi:uncharacterized protein (TIGR02271 family)